MIVYPAIDLRRGKVVQLKEGRVEQETVFGDDPIAQAQSWIAQGAAWLHLVSLDGAFAQANDNLSVLRKITALGTPVQFGGGLRTLDNVAQALDLGAARVILGTVAVQNPQLVTDAVARFGADAICVALDARDGKVTMHGWQSATSITPTELGAQMAQAGVRHALYTDVSRDGHLGGSSVDDTIALARATGLQVIASGGVTGLDEIRALAQSGAVAGVIIGTALYTGRIKLADALSAASQHSALGTRSASQPGIQH